MSISKRAISRRQRLRLRNQHWRRRSAMSTATVAAALASFYTPAAQASQAPSATPLMLPNKVSTPTAPRSVKASISPTKSRRKMAATFSPAASAKSGISRPAKTAPRLTPFETVPSDSSQGHMADPTTLWDGQSYDYTFGTNDSGWDACGNSPSQAKFYMPMFKTPSTNNTTGSTFGGECFLSDAMPNGPGSWATGGYSGDTWAPGLVSLNGQYVMYYTSQKAGTGQQCIGRASSSSIGGPYTGGSQWFCGPSGRWAIDPQPFQSGGNTYVAFRDDSVASGKHTGISIVQVDNSGAGIWSTKKTAFISNSDLDQSAKWATITNPPSPAKLAGNDIVENPAVIHGQGSDTGFFLLFSGNDYGSVKYSVGIAACGNNPLPASRCKAFPSSANPYWGWLGSGDNNAIYQLPGNHTGPGGMSVYKAGSGTMRADWAWVNTALNYPFYGEYRHAMNGGIFESGSGNGSTWTIQ